MPPGENLWHAVRRPFELMIERLLILSFPRLAQIALDTAHLPVNAISQAIRQEVEAFIAGAPLPDDVTLVVLRVTA